MTSGKKATIREVASIAGVSIQTVSRVLNDHQYVADETRQRVIEAIKKLDYRPDAIARSLINRRSYTLGVVAGEVDFYGPQRLLNGIEKQSAALGYSLLLSIIHHHDVDHVARVVDNLLSHQVDGIIWTAPEIDSNHEWIRSRLRQVTNPLIFVFGGISGGLPTVFSDNRAGGRLATEHLLAQGYRQIGLITGPRTWTVARERQLGWQDALAVANIPRDTRRVVEGDWSAASGERGLYQLIEQFPEMDAVFVSNDQMALGVLQAAHLLGRRVPEELAVVGYDAVPDSAYFWPPLTSVRQHLMEVGSTTVREITRLIERQHNGETEAHPLCIGIQPQLIVRRSSASSSSGSRSNGGLRDRPNR
jgi:LacI family transcriptional regulator